VWTKSRARDIYVSVDVVATVFAIYIYISTICPFNSTCRQGVCLCGQSRYLICICVWYIYICCHYSSTQLRLPTGSVIVWTKSLVRYIHISVDVFFKYFCLLNSACRQGVCLCGQSRYTIRIYVSDIYIYCHYSSAKLCLPKLGVCVCGRSCVFNVCICIYGYCRYRIYILLLFDMCLCVWYTYIYCHVIHMLMCMPMQKRMHALWYVCTAWCEHDWVCEFALL